MTFEVGILHDCEAWAAQILRHAAALYDGKICDLTIVNPDAGSAEHLQYLDCRLPFVAETRLTSINLSERRTPSLKPVYARLKTLVLLICDEGGISGLQRAMEMLEQISLSSTALTAPECMVLVASELIETAEAKLEALMSASTNPLCRLFMIPVDHNSADNATQLIHRFISGQREAEIALLIDAKWKRMPHFNEAERIIAAHALKDKIVDVANAMRAKRHKSE